MSCFVPLHWMHPTSSELLPCCITAPAVACWGRPHVLPFFLPMKKGRKPVTLFCSACECSQCQLINIKSPDFCEPRGAEDLSACIAATSI